MCEFKGEPLGLLPLSFDMILLKPLAIILPVFVFPFPVTGGGGCNESPTVADSHSEPSVRDLFPASLVMSEFERGFFENIRWGAKLVLLRLLN